MARTLKVDMTGVETFQRAEEGTQVVKIRSIEQKQSEGGNDGLKCVFEVIKGADKGCRVMENYPLMDTALWKLKSLLQAINMKADGKLQLDLDKMEGKVLVIEVKHEEYSGVLRAKVAECKKFEADSDEEDDEEDDDEDETPVVKKKAAPAKAASKKKVVEEEEDEDDEDEDEEDEEEEEEVKPKKKAPAKKAPAKKKVVEDDDDDEDEEDEEEEEEVKPKKKAPAKAPAKAADKKKPAKKKAPVEDDDDEDDDEDWDDEDEE